MKHIFANEFLSGIRYLGSNADLEFRFSDTTPDLTARETGSILCKKIYAYKLNHNVSSTEVSHDLHWCSVCDVSLFEVENKNEPGSDLTALTAGSLHNGDVPIDGNFTVLVMDGQVTVAVACSSVDILKRN